MEVYETAMKFYIELMEFYWDNKEYHDYCYLKLIGLACYRLSRLSKRMGNT